MPNIRETQAPGDLGLRPDDRATESTANAGRRISSMYSQVAEATMDTGRRFASAAMDVGTVAQKYVEHQEISKGAAEAATTLSSLDAKWNERVKNADPNDPTVAAKFREETLEPTLQKLGEGPITEGGQRFAEAQVEKFRNHFIEKTSADMGRLARVAVSQNIETLKNQLSNMAINDPTSLKTSLGMVEHSVGAMVDSSPNLRGVDGAAMKLELTGDTQKAIVKAAAIGAINANPEAGLKQFSSPEYSKYISGAELKQLEQQAKTVQRAQRVDDENRLKIQKMEKEDASDAREGEYLQKLHSGDPKEMATVSAKTIANDFTLTRTARERMIGIAERALEPEAPARISNGTATDLISRIRAPSGDPRRITDLGPVYDAYEKGQLTKADLKFVRDEFTNIRTPEGEALGRQQDDFVKGVKAQITGSNPMMGKIDATGDQKVYEFTIALQNKVAEYRRAGKDPRDLMDPSKPDYMGSPAAIAPFQKSLQESLADTARNLGGGAPATREPAFVPPKDWQFSPSRQQYKDPSGKIYDGKGKPVAEKQSSLGEEEIQLLTTGKAEGGALSKIASALNPIGTAHADGMLPDDRKELMGKDGLPFWQSRGETADAYNARMQPYKDKVTEAAEKFNSKPVDKWSVAEIERFRASKGFREAAKLALGKITGDQ